MIKPRFKNRRLGEFIDDEKPSLHWEGPPVRFDVINVVGLPFCKSDGISKINMKILEEAIEEKAKDGWMVASVLRMGISDDIGFPLEIPVFRVILVKPKS